MTKTLTKQWREGTLPDGWYYVKDINNEIYIAQQYTYGPSICSYEEEVLAPVPSYEEYKELTQKVGRLELDNEALEMAHNEGKEINAELVSKTEQLEKKLAIATKALKKIAKDSVQRAEQAFEEMELRR